MNLKNVIIYLALLSLVGCDKLVQIPPPVSSITTQQVFADSADASAAVLGMYTKMIDTRTTLDFGSGALTVCGGLSSDELVDFLGSNSGYNGFYINQLQSTYGNLYSAIWQNAYPIIYQANACIEGAQSSTGLTPAVKNQITGEAKFIRAFCYFYLVNLFGAVPYVTTTDYHLTEVMARTPVDQVYQGIVQDLTDARQLLPDDFSISASERIRANQGAAAAMLARVYLYQGLWDSADVISTAVLEDPNYSMVNDLSHVFDANSPEAILQWNMNSNIQPFNATPEGFNMIPSRNIPYPSYYLSNQLLQAIEPGDQRKSAWINTTTYSGTLYYYPYKYTIGVPNYQVGGTPTQYYTVMRLAEQWLIRAEARAHENTNLPGAISDLNQIRERAGLADLPTTLSQSEVLAAVAQERRIEFFAEWGHRWLDLKRTGQIDAVMDTTTPHKIGGKAWNTDQQLYPIPQNQLAVDPNLKQNPGY